MSTHADLNIYITTFNCGRTLIKPEAFASHFFDALPESASRPQPPELIVIKLQEIAPLAEAFHGNAITKYFDLFEKAVRLAAKQRFGTEALIDDGYGTPSGDYVEVRRENVGLTAIMLFVRTDLESRIGHISVAGVGVGVMRTGHKGAVGLRVSWRTTDTTAKSNSTESKDVMNLTFVAAHLAPMEEQVERRNQDYLDIAAGLVFEPKQTPSSIQRDSQPSENAPEQESEPLLSSTSQSPSSSSLIGIYSPDAHLFFSGDLNYRTSNTPPDLKTCHDPNPRYPSPTLPLTDPNHYLNLLLPNDQLTTQLKTGKTLHGLTESPITFPPTYKYDASTVPAGKDLITDTDLTEWKWSRHRWPSWCDRILYSTPPTQINVHNYTALPLLATSDHRPVALSFSIPQKPVWNPEFAAKRPVVIDVDWKENRAAAVWKEGVVGVVWGTVGNTDGLLNLTMGVAAVLCVAVFVAVYAREW